MAWNVLVVVLMVIPTLVGAREGLKRVLQHEFDKVLREDLQEIRLAVRQFSSDPDWLQRMLARKAAGHAHREWFVQLFNANGKMVWASDASPDLDLPAGTQGPMRFLDYPPYRLVQGPLDAGPNVPVFVRVGASYHDVIEDIGLLTRMMILAGASILVLTPLGCYWLAGRATAPLDRIIRTTARLRPDRLQERLPLRGSADELDRLSQTINRLLDRIAADLRQNRDFVANAAHELRSPLAAIQATVEVALAGARSPEESAEVLEEVLDGCDRLRVLVNQLLLLAEGDAGQLAAGEETTCLDQVAARAVAMFQGVAEAQELSLQFRCTSAVRVRGREQHLRQVVCNLIDNAIKYNRPGGQVVVEVEGDPIAHQARLRVSDTGAGITAADLPRIFERFYRSDASRQHDSGVSGTGLGLSICQSIVHALQGAIAVESEPGQGSRFSITLPLGSEVRIREPAASRGPGPGGVLS
jgi:two-component system, OmpR family, heavy metal sensor histidine kinase CusS